MLVKTKEEPKYVFNQVREMYARDPMGGLPMRSVEGPPKSDKPLVPSPATIDEAAVTNPYDLGVDDEGELTEEPKIEVTTNPQPGITVTTPTDPAELTEDPEDIGQPKVEEKAEFTTPEDPKTGAESETAEVLTKTEIRRMTKTDLIAKAKEVTDNGCLLNPELAEKMAEVGVDMHKGKIVRAFLTYYGHESE